MEESVARTLKNLILQDVKCDIKRTGYDKSNSDGKKVNRTEELSGNSLHTNIKQRLKFMKPKEYEKFILLFCRSTMVSPDIRKIYPPNSLDSIFPMRKGLKFSGKVVPIDYSSLTKVLVDSYIYSSDNKKLENYIMTLCSFFKIRKIDMNYLYRFDGITPPSGINLFANYVRILRNPISSE